MHKLTSRRIASFLTLFALIMLAPSKVGGALCMPPEAKPNSPYHYLLALTNALGWAKSARDRLMQSHSTNKELLSSITESILAIKLADRDYECAVTILLPYKGSHHDVVKTSAKSAATVFSMLVELDKQFIAHYKKLLSLREADQDLGIYVEQTAELGAKADDIWKMLPLAAVASTYSIVEADPTTGKLAGLSLTAAQRAEILKKLSDTFGASVQKGMQAGQLSLEAAAGVLYQFLSDKRWKSKDSH